MARKKRKLYRVINEQGVEIETSTPGIFAGWNVVVALTVAYTAGSIARAGCG